MHSVQIESQGKCRKLFFATVDGPPKLDESGDPTSEKQHVAGDVLDVMAGGGAIEHLTGTALIVARFNDHTAPERIGCIEEFYNPIPATRPLRVDLTKVPACCDAVDAHWAAVQAEVDFVFEKGIKLFGSEQSSTETFRHSLKVQEMHTRDDSGRASDHDTIVQTQTDLEALCKTCEDCCEQLLVTRDAAVTFAEPGA